MGARTFETHLPETFRLKFQSRAPCAVGSYVFRKLSARDKLIGTGLSLASQHPILWFSNIHVRCPMKRVEIGTGHDPSRMNREEMQMELWRGITALFSYMGVETLFG